MNKKKKLNRLVICAFFMALTVVMTFTPLGYIPVGVISITTIHIATILGACILLTGSYRVFYIGDISISSIVFLIAGTSLLANCAPSFEDALSFKDYLYSKETSLFVKIILTPHFVVSYFLFKLYDIFY